MTGYHTYQSCIEACLKCAAICNHCASSCTEEEDVKMMARCIQLDMECAAICYASAQLMSLGSDKAKEICRICADICEACAAESHERNYRSECAISQHSQWWSIDVCAGCEAIPVLVYQS